MGIVSSTSTGDRNKKTWLERVFAAKTKVIRRSKRNVERFAGTEEFKNEAKRRGFHLIEIGDQFLLFQDSHIIVQF